MANPALYPLLFDPALQTRVWGGRELGTELGKKLPSSEPFGESWEIYWKNKIANGPYTGKTLGELITEQPRAMVGLDRAHTEYPLLVKFIDAQDWLSVQVHPNDHFAAQLEGQARGKTECWYILHAKPGAQLAYGLKESLDAARFRAALAQPGRVKETLQFVDVAAGDFIYVPAGMMHAIGPGVLIYELQQTSDTTYRVYDWDRMGLDGKPRKLHVDKSLTVMNFEVNPPAKVPYSASPDGVATLIDGAYFSLRKLTGKSGGSFKLADNGHARLLSVTRGAASLRGSHESVMLSKGISTFIPAALESETITFESDTEILWAWDNKYV